MTSRQWDLARIHARYVELVRELEERRKVEAEVRAEVHSAREEITQISRVRDQQPTSNLSPTERKALELEGKRSHELLMNRLQELKSKAFRNYSKSFHQQQAVINTIRRAKFFPDLPPTPPDPPEWLKNLLDWIGSHSIRHGQLTPPAYACDNPAQQGATCFPEAGLFKISYHASGQGDAWGWEASPSGPWVSESLVFVYLPTDRGRTVRFSQYPSARYSARSRRQPLVGVGAC